MSTHQQPTREQINTSAAQYGFRLPTAADSCDTADARAYFDNMTAVQRGTITVDEMRARNREMRERIGDTAYEMAQASAIAASTR